MSKWIKNNDKVMAITGNDKGSKGVVLVRKGDKVIVQGLNLKKKTVKMAENPQNIIRSWNVQTNFAGTGSCRQNTAGSNTTT